MKLPFEGLPSEIPTYADYDPYAWITPELRASSKISAALSTFLVLDTLTEHQASKGLGRWIASLFNQDASRHH